MRGTPILAGKSLEKMALQDVDHPDLPIMYRMIRKAQSESELQWAKSFSQ
jgi:hypothetical protein